MAKAIPPPPSAKESNQINFRLSDDGLAKLDRAVKIYLELHPEHFAVKNPKRQRSLVIRAALEAFLPTLEEEKAKHDQLRRQKEFSEDCGLV